jgi:ABC-type multidrug transport system fused ATPase/permease subunit
MQYIRKDRTMFVIAHRLSTVRDADVIIVVEKGRILERGTHEELMSMENGIYRGLYRVQNNE